MNNLTVKARIVLGFAAVILIVMGIGLLTFNHLNAIRQETLDVTGDSLPGLWCVTRIEAASIEEQSLVQSFILTPPGQARLAEETSIQAAGKGVSDLFADYEATIHQEQDREQYKTLVQARAAYLSARTDALRQARGVALGGDQVAIIRPLNAHFNEYRDQLRTIAELNKKMSEVSAREIMDAVVNAQKAIATGLILSIVLASLCGIFLVRAVTQPLNLVVDAIAPMRRGDLSGRISHARSDEFGVLAVGLNGLADDLTGIIGQVQKATMQVNTSVTEIAATARQQQATAAEIAATTTEVGATSKEISATSKELVKSMSQVSVVAERTADLALSGQDGLGRMETTMHQIMDASGSISDRLAVLSEKAGNINTVVTTIAKVADQTNLLSLNAAIEAEKAGEYGRGFAVVASEIRRLADQTALATLDIEQMVKEMQSAVSAGVMGLDKFSDAVRRGVEVVASVGDQLTQIIGQVQQLTPNFEAVNEGMQSQSIGAQQISEALSQLSEAAQQTVESLRQSNMAIEQLNETVRGLQGSVTRFTLS